MSAWFEFAKAGMLNRAKGWQLPLFHARTSSTSSETSRHPLMYESGREAPTAGQKADSLLLAKSFKIRRSQCAPP